MNRGSGVRALATAMMVLGFRLWRSWISPLVGSHCRFTPSCSAYAEDAVVRFGPVRGAVVAGRRLLRCHPWHPGGVDPVPAVPR